MTITANPKTLGTFEYDGHVYTVETGARTPHRLGVKRDDLTWTILQLDTGDTCERPFWIGAFGAEDPALRASILAHALEVCKAAGYDPIVI